jgi:hypothetical protein
MARTARGGRGTRGVLVVGRWRPLTGAKEHEASMHPSPSITATGGQDDAVTPSARVPSARCNGSPPNRSVEQPAHEWGRFPLDPSARAAHLSLPDGRKPDWPTRQPDSRARAKPDLEVRQGRRSPVERCRDAFSDRCAKAPHRSSHDQRCNERAFPQVQCNIVGLAGLEPAASSSSAIEGSALCGPAFP